MRELLLYLRVLLTPRLWARFGRVDPAWDRRLRKLIADGEPAKFLSEYFVQIGPFPVWVANWPYAAGDVGIDESGFPSRRTVILLGDHLKRHGLRRGKQVDHPALRGKWMRREK